MSHSPTAPKLNSAVKSFGDIMKWGLALLFVLLLLAGCFLYRLAATLEGSYTSMPPVQAACVIARLNPPPGEIVRAESHVLLAGNVHMQFKADRGQIEAWLRNSPGTTNLTVSATYSTSRELKFVDHDAWLKNAADSERFDVEVIEPAAEWFTPSIRNGVRYEVLPHESHDRGSIFIDWDSNTVWIRASHS